MISPVRFMHFYKVDRPETSGTFAQIQTTKNMQYGKPAKHQYSNWLRWISTNAFSLALSTFGWLQHAILFKCFHPFLLPFETTSIASIGQFLNQANPTPLVGLEEITGWHFGTSLGLDHEIRLWGTIQMAMWSRIIPVKCNGWWVWKLKLKIYVVYKFIYLMITETLFLLWWSTRFASPERNFAWLPRELFKQVGSNF